MERTYYSLEDIRKNINLGELYKGPMSMLASSTGFIQFMNTCLSYNGYSTIVGTNEAAEAYTCFANYIWPRFYQEAIIYVDSDEDTTFVDKFCLTKLGQIFA